MAFMSPLMSADFIYSQYRLIRTELSVLSDVNEEIVVEVKIACNSQTKEVPWDLVLHKNRNWLHAYRLSFEWNFKKWKSATAIHLQWENE